MNQVTAVEEIADGILASMEELAPIYGVDIEKLPAKDYVMHVVASLLNDGVIEEKRPSNEERV